MQDSDLACVRIALGNLAQGGLVLCYLAGEVVPLQLVDLSSELPILETPKAGNLLAQALQPVALGLCLVETLFHEETSKQSGNSLEVYQRKFRVLGKLQAPWSKQRLLQTLWAEALTSALPSSR